MQIVMLAAGLSVRMGEQNKMLLPCRGMSLVTYSAMEALAYLESLNEKSALIMVTGYEDDKVREALMPCGQRVKKINETRTADTGIELIIAYNSDYISGQFSSTQTGMKLVKDGEDFFITLADMASLKAEHYAQISEISEKIGCEYAAVRPFRNGVPGHPVWHRAFLKDVILRAKKSSKVSDILKKYDVYNAEVTDKAYTTDIDTPKEFEDFSKENI